MLRLAFLIPVITSLFSHALTVNRLNGGASITYIDFSVPGSAVPLELIRTYNSITAINESNAWLGVFGWGWTSGMESTLTTTPERHVLLRDGATGNTIVFKPESEDVTIREDFFKSLKKAYFERKLSRAPKPEELAKLQLPEKMEARLKSDPKFRFEMALKYNVKGTVPRGELLISSEYGYQTLQLKGNLWIREKEGISQFFDGEGRLIRQRSRNGFTFEYKYSPTQRLQLAEISAPDKTASLKFVYRADRVVEVIDNRAKKSKYVYDAFGNLASSTDSNGVTYIYKYENKKFSHLMTRIEYPDESKEKEKIYREMTYDNNGLLVAHRDKDGSETRYNYGKSPKDPDNNFFTKTVMKQGGTTSELYEEFFLKNRPDGTKFLFKQETKQNGVSTVTLFTPCCGKPSQIIKNGEVTTFKYYETGLFLGLLKEKVSPKESILLEYDSRWKKVKKVNQNGFISAYEYDDNGNLVQASNGNKERVTLKYYASGRIRMMTDPLGKQIAFKYGALGKPVLITDKGIGTIRIEYDGQGRILKTETLIPMKNGRKPSQLASQEVVRRVMEGFQRLLDIIRPAGVTLTAG